jgi:hypothetical protein
MPPHVVCMCVRAMQPAKGYCILSRKTAVLTGIGSGRDSGSTKGDRFFGSGPSSPPHLFLPMAAAVSIAVAVAAERTRQREVNRRPS